MDSMIKWMQMATFSVKYDKECMASLKPESSHKSSSPNNDSTKQDTARVRSHWDTGTTNGVQSVSLWSSTISE